VRKPFRPLEAAAAIKIAAPVVNPPQSSVSLSLLFRVSIPRLGLLSDLSRSIRRLSKIRDWRDRWDRWQGDSFEIYFLSAASDSARGCNRDYNRAG